MPRPPRTIPADSVVHAINRGNDRQRLFDVRGDYESFLKLLLWAKKKCDVRILAYCLMPNHWHVVLWSRGAGDVSRFFQRLCTTHASRRRRGTGTIGDGHVYQHRFHAFVVTSERQYFNVMRYVEANGARSGLVERAEQWRWSSLAERLGRSRGILDHGPLSLPKEWAALVNESLPEEFLEETRARFRRRRDLSRRGRRPAAVRRGTTPARPRPTR